MSIRVHAMGVHAMGVHAMHMLTHVLGSLFIYIFMLVSDSFRRKFNLSSIDALACLYTFVI